jgi:hypothetical protein
MHRSPPSGCSVWPLRVHLMFARSPSLDPGTSPDMVGIGGLEHGPSRVRAAVSVRVGTQVLGSPLLRPLDDISAVLRDDVVDQVLIAIPRDMISALTRRPWCAVLRVLTFTRALQYRRLSFG